MGLCYLRDALSWLSVWRRRLPIVRAAVADQVLLMLSFLVVGCVCAFVTVLHVATFGGTLRIALLALMSAFWLFYGAWFAWRRYYARPVLKIFGVDLTSYSAGASLLQPDDRRRMWAEPWRFSGATLHGLGDWRGEPGAVHRLSAVVGDNLAIRTRGIDTTVRPDLGFAAALAGVLGPAIVVFVFTPMFFGELAQ
jgi:hypothetical protein